MSAHVSVFDIKRFTEERLSREELPVFERHLAACAACAAHLQRAAVRELRVRGLDGHVLPPVTQRAPALAVALALAASFAFFIVSSRGFSTPLQTSPDTVDIHGSTPLTFAPADGGVFNNSLAFYDGGEHRP
ncbi:MAG: hypothetical protein K1X64_22180 [Myxococcaceae bacterium]|nr:hypothetical protein [Myxococcaceae bacterium]